MKKHSRTLLSLALGATMMMTVGACKKSEETEKPDDTQQPEDTGEGVDAPPADAGPPQDPDPEAIAEARAHYLLGQHEEAVGKLEPVRDVYRLAGNHDFLLRIVVPDMAAFDRFYAELTDAIRLRRVNSFFALETVRTTTTLPLEGLIAAS